MTTAIDLVNRALMQAGARETINDFNEGSTSAIIAKQLYQPTFEQIGRAAYWNCLKGQNFLTLLKAAQGTPENQDGTVLPLPPQPWLYEYLLPNDCLKIRYLLPNYTPASASTVPLFPISSSIILPAQARGKIDFAVARDTDASGNALKVIQTNLTQAQAIYTINDSNPEMWDSQLQAAFVAALAAFMIPPLNMNAQLLGMQVKIADGVIASARASDGNEGVHSQNREASWIAARGCGAWSNGDSFWQAPYDEISWPSVN